MEILLCGGFLGSGKTTLLNKLLRGMTAQGITAAVVENEVGQEGIDAALLEAEGLRVTPLFGGCVCCQISGDLLKAVQRIEDELAPDWIVVEMTGVALMDGIRDTFRQYGRSGLNIHTLSVVDMVRWPKLLQGLRPVITRQLAEANVVAANKADLASPTSNALEEIAALAPGAVLVPMNAAGMEPAAAWKLIRDAFALREEGST